MQFINISSKRRNFITLLTLAIFVTLSTSFVTADTPDRVFGDVQILATVPFPPGFPEGIAANGDKIYVAGPASFDTAGTPASKVFAYDSKTGALLDTYEIEGEFTQFPHANSCIAFDGEGRLCREPEIGNRANRPRKRVLRLVNAPPLPNDIAFDEVRNLYFTDSFQATIWRIAPGGGLPQIWFQDSRLDTPFGANGLRLSPDNTKIYFVVTAEGPVGSPNLSV